MVKFVPTVQTVDPHQAELWLNNPYKHQRAINMDHVNDLARAMYEGTFSPTNSIMLSGIHGETHLLNGRHTCQAIVKSGKAQTMTVIFYTVDTEAEEAELYFRTDRPRKRTFADSMRATNIPNILNLTPTMIHQGASALRFIKNGFGATRTSTDKVSDDDLVQWLPDWAWEIKAVHRAIHPTSAKERNLVIRMAVMSVAMITMRSAHTQAREFWNQVARDDGIKREDPRKTLRQWLMDAQGQSIAPGKRLRNDQIARGAALAWNAWTDDKALKAIVVHDRSSIMRINLSDYDGSQGHDYLPLYPVTHVREVIE